MYTFYPYQNRSSWDMDIALGCSVIPIIFLMNCSTLVVTHSRYIDSTTYLFIKIPSLWSARFTWKYVSYRPVFNGDKLTFLLHLCDRTAWVMLFISACRLSVDKLREPFNRRTLGNGVLHRVCRYKSCSHLTRDWFFVEAKARWYKDHEPSWR